MTRRKPAIQKVQCNIVIRLDQKQYVDKYKYNLSKLVRTHLDNMMEAEKKFEKNRPYEVEQGGYFQ